MSLRKRHIVFWSLLVLFPMGVRTEVEDYTAARRYCLTWVMMKISPYVVESPTELTRWLTEKVGTGGHAPAWLSLGDNILGFQSYRHGPPPGRFRLRMFFWHFYLVADEQEKEQVIALARRYFDTTDPSKRSVISAEAFKKWGRSITPPPAAPHMDPR